MKLYSYYRSSASYRVRIALGLKGLSSDIIPVNLLKAEQKGDYAQVNPQMLLPSLVLDSGEVLTQSIAIMEYLDEVHPSPALLPLDAVSRAKARAMALAVACDIAPLGNSGTMSYLGEALGVSEAQKTAWIRHWITKGLLALEALVQGDFCAGDAPGMADCCLVPQLYNARRFGCDMHLFPKLVAIDARCAGLAAFAAAHPDKQVDAA